jgi:hypothetical protein
LHTSSFFPCMLCPVDLNHGDLISLTIPDEVYTLRSPSSRNCICSDTHCCRHSTRQEVTPNVCNQFNCKDSYVLLGSEMQEQIFPNIYWH